MRYHFAQANAILGLATLSLTLLGLASGSGATWTKADIARAMQEKVDEKTIRELIQQLGDDSFEKREDASKRLAEIGESAAELLQRAAKDSPDAEIRQRAGQLVGSMDNKFFSVVETIKPKVDLGAPRATRLAMMPDGKQIVVASKSSPFVWDYSTRKETPSGGGTNNYTCLAVAVSADARRVILGLAGKKGHVFDLPTGKMLKQLNHTGPVNGVAMLPDGKTALTGSSDKSIRVWDVDTGNEIRHFNDTGDGVRSLSLSRDGKTAATGHFVSDKNRAMVRLWDVDKGSEIRSFAGHTDEVTSVAFSPDGKSLLSSSHDKTVRLWDLETGKETKRFEAGTGRVEAAAFTPDGKRLVSGGDEQDSSLRLWDIQSGQLVLRSRAVGSAVTGLVVLPDGRRCVTSGSDGVIRLWEWKK